MIVLNVTLLLVWAFGVLVAAVDTRRVWHGKNRATRLPPVTALGRRVPPAAVVVAVCVTWPVVPLVLAWLRREVAGRGSR